MFQHLRCKVGLEKSEAKINKDVFVSPEIRELMLDDEFEIEIVASWISSTGNICASSQNFLGNLRAENLCLTC